MSVELNKVMATEKIITNEAIPLYYGDLELYYTKEKKAISELMDMPISKRLEIISNKRWGGPKQPFVVQVDITCKSLNQVLDKTFLEFIELNDKKAILNFATNYGLLSEGTVLIPESLSFYSNSKSTKINDLKYVGTYGEPITLWFKQIAEMRVVHDIWLAVKNENQEYLQDNISGEKDNYGAFILIKHRGIKNFVSTLDTWFSVSDLKSLAINFLTEFMNQKLSINWVAPKLDVNFDGIPKIYGQYYSKRILSTLWYQLFRTIIGELRFERCSVCRSWEDVTDKRTTWTKHPKCSNRERQRRIQDKKKGKSDG